MKHNFHRVNNDQFKEQKRAIWNCGKNVSGDMQRETNKVAFEINFLKLRVG